MTGLEPQPGDAQPRRVPDRDHFENLRKERARAARVEALCADDRRTVAGALERMLGYIEAASVLSTIADDRATRYCLANCAGLSRIAMESFRRIDEIVAGGAR